MDEILIENWNKRIKPTDTVYHLGDFSWHPYEQSKDIFARLNGRKILIIGNHDHSYIKDLNWEFSGNYSENKWNKKSFVLMHYPIEEWNGRFRGSYHMFGHVHLNPISYIPNRYNVGVDSNNFSPINLEEILEEMENEKLQNNI